MARAALATGLKSGITSVGKPRRPGKKKAWEVSERVKLLDPVMVKSYVFDIGRVA